MQSYYSKIAVKSNNIQEYAFSFFAVVFLSSFLSFRQVGVRTGKLYPRHKGKKE
jgi:hypothetical protein